MVNYYQLQSPPPGKILAEVGPFRNVGSVSPVIPGDGQPIRQNVGMAAVGTQKAVFRNNAIIGG